MKNLQFKEVLIVFVLAVLVTGGSWLRTSYVPKSFWLSPADPFTACDRTTHGWPLSYWVILENCKRSLFAIVVWGFYHFILDLLFWFLAIFAVWIVVKWIKRKI